MKTGYSILLGQYINADLINYTDCKNFQIICPICKEPVFKVERNKPAPTLHYLSHYEASKTYVADCELRVKAIIRKDQETANNISRYQNLKYFLSVLRKEVLKREFGPDSENMNKVKNLINQFMASSGVRAFKDNLFEVLRSSPEMQNPKNLNNIYDDYIKDVESVGGALPFTEMAIINQKRITTDVWLHLLSAKAIKNYSFLFCVGLLHLNGRIDLAQKERPLYEYEKKLLVFTNGLVLMGKHEAVSQLKLFYRTPIGPPHAMSGSNYLNKLSAEIHHEMFGILLRLPYFEMLKRAKITREKVAG